MIQSNNIASFQQMALFSLVFIAFWVALGFTPLNAHPVETHDLLSHGSLERQDLLSLIPLQAPQYSSASPTSQTQPLNLSYSTLTMQVLRTVTTVQYRTCTKVAPGTPPCQDFIVAPEETSVAPVAPSTTSRRPSLLVTSQVQTRLKNDDASVSERPGYQPQSSGSETNGLLKSQALKLAESNSVASLLGEEDIFESGTANTDRPTARVTEEERQLLKSHRTARLITGPSNIVITKLVTETLTSTVTVTGSQTTVAITYGGCVPRDVVTATVCHP